MGKRITSLQTASSVSSTDYLPIDGNNGTKKISAGFLNDIVTDVTVDGTSVVSNGTAAISLSGKQDTLIPGSNITIGQDGKTISATDTTYSDMVGAGASTAGTHGLVPAPTSGDNTKFLRGDGTWQDVGGGGGSSTLAGLTDVSLSSPTDGQGLIYDATNQEWVNGNVGGGGSSTLAGLTDTDINTPSDGQALIYDSTNGKWENGSVSATASVSTLTDVTLSGVADGQILKYDASSQKWVNANESGGGSFPANWGITTTALTANNVVTGDPWTVANDTDYYDTAVRFVISTAVYQKTNANPALGGVYLVSASGSTWTCGIFVSTDSSAVSYTYNTEPWGSFTYLGRTWYFSGTAYALSGDRHTEVDGVRYIGDFTAYDYDSKECAIEAGKYLIDNAGVKFTSDLFTAMFPPSSGSLFAGGGIKADLTDAPFKVTDGGAIYGSDIIIGGNSLLSTKQDTLTVGNYIDITNDEISVVGNSRYYQGSLVARVTAADSRITASSYSTSYGDYPPWKAFDGTSPTDLRNVGDYCWTAEPNTTNQWIQYHFDSAKYLTKVEISSFSNYSDAWVGTVKVEGSTDGTTFTNILASGTTYTLTAPLQALGTSTINLNKQNSWNYIRITFVEAMGVAYQPSIFVDEIYIYGGDPARNIVSEVDFTKLSNQQVADLRSAIGGGGSSEVTYSTTEHVVGTWIDGSTLYEKTIYYAPAVSGSATIDSSLNTSNVDYFVCIELSYVCNNSYQGSGLPIEIAITSSGVIEDVNHATGASITETYATVRYTKVSTS